MKFDRLLEKTCPGYSFYGLAAYDRWCCGWLMDYTVTAMLTNGGEDGLRITWDWTMTDHGSSSATFVSVRSAGSNLS